MTEHKFSLSSMQAAIKVVADGGHSVFSPSGSKMWMGCSGSLIPNIYAEDDSGEDAAYGTVGHSVGEKWLKKKRRPTELVGTTEVVVNGGVPYEIEIDDDMLDHVRRYVDWCEFLPGQHFVEVKVYFSQLTPIPDQGGTADHVACTYQRMIITDLKLGKGNLVHAKNNSQAMLYALGFFYAWDWLYDFQEFVLRIAQPRMGNFDEHIVRRTELLEFAERVKVRAFAAWQPNAPRTPSVETCQWCKVKSTCAANTKMLWDMTAGVFTSVEKEMTTKELKSFRGSIELMSEPSMADIATLTTDELGILYGFKSLMVKFFDSAAVELTRRGANGVQLRDWKQVEGRSFREFRSQAAAVAGFMKLGIARDELFKEEFISITGAETLLRKHGYKSKDLSDLLEPLTRKPKGKPTLARRDDPRPALTDNTADVFCDTINPENPHCDNCEEI